MADFAAAAASSIDMDVGESPSSVAKTSGVGANSPPECSGACGPSGAAAGALFDLDGLPIKNPSEKLDIRYILGHAPIDDDDDDGGVTASGSGSSAGREEGRGGGGVVAGDATALIESQFQPYDENDLEYGDSSDDEAAARQEAAWRAGGTDGQARQRRSSLKNVLRSPSSDHGSAEPSHHVGGDNASVGSGDGGSGSGCSSPGPCGHQDRKAVRFADVEGQGQLIEVHNLVNSDEPPTVPASALKDLHVRRRKRSRTGLTWTLDFDQPGSDPGFITRVLHDKVALENCVALTDEHNPLTISGIVRVANIAYDKRVHIRWTADGWTSPACPADSGTHEVLANYLPGSSDGCTDRFAFVIHPTPEVVDVLHRRAEAVTAVAAGTVSPPAAAPRLEFVISYEAGGAGGAKHWDNNSGRNYGIVLSVGVGSGTTPSTPSASQIQFADVPSTDSVSASLSSH